MKKRTQNSFLIIVFFTFVDLHLALAQTKGKPVYLANLVDPEDETLVYHCQKKRCQSSGVYLNSSAVIQTTGSAFKAFTVDEYDDVESEEVFLPVQFNYIDAKKSKKFIEGTGYLPKYVISEKKYSAFFDVHPSKNQRLPASIQKNDFSAITQKIYDLVGFCPLEKPYIYPKKLPKENIYDSMIYTKIKNQKIPLIKNEKNKKLTADDLINIDALARTIYGEMGKCFNKGLQYPIAAALVAINRYENQARFREWTGSYTKRTVAHVPPLTRIVTTPEKFNNWMTKNRQKPNGPLHHSLCPPKFINKPFWKSEKASAGQVKIWKNAVRIATEAVLYPTKFKSRSPAMKNINFYTSGLGQYNDFLQVFPFVNERPLENFNCIEMWKEPR